MRIRIIWIGYRWGSVPSESDTGTDPYHLNRIPVRIRIHDPTFPAIQSVECIVYQHNLTLKKKIFKEYIFSKIILETFFIALHTVERMAIFENLFRSRLCKWSESDPICNPSYNTLFMFFNIVFLVRILPPPFRF